MFSRVILPTIACLLVTHAALAEETQSEDFWLSQTERAYKNAPVDMRAMDILPPVAQRNFPEWQPRGLMLGTVMVFPSIELEGEYTDNLYGTHNNTRDDYAMTTRGQVLARMGKDRFHLNAGLGLEAIRYAQEEDENVENFSIGVDGDYEAHSDLKLFYSARYDDFHAKRNDNLSFEFTRKPLNIKHSEIEGGATYTFNRLGLTTTGRYKTKRYENDLSLNTNALVVKDDADANTIEGEVKLSYEFPVNHVASVAATVGQSDYLRLSYNDATGQYSGVNRDSDYYGVSAELESDYKGIVSTKFNLGYIMQNYDDATLDDISTMRGSAQATWNMTQLTTLGLKLYRDVIEDNDVVQGAVATGFGLSLDHELRRNVILKAGFDLVQRDFEGSNREDDIKRARAGFLYKITPHFHLDGEYSHGTQETNIPDNSYDENVVMLRLKAQY